ncbi:hypothetical protein BN2476_70069 [Paraburkholderia piptadeniae]|uniref:Uncharacterized protein n=1 Tax=Paraburkholderia piptadeniae TaxID=1701573 RepID=A0A1N7RMH9_9BURK|nr:hypothetical protein BN2476_70069 [Paraburkholderia piptadeniae]
MRQGRARTFFEPSEVDWQARLNATQTVEIDFILVVTELIHRRLVRACDALPSHTMTTGP